MNPVLATDGSAEQTAAHIASQHCVRAAGVGAGALDKGKGMTPGVVG